MTTKHVFKTQRRLVVLLDGEVRYERVIRPKQADTGGGTQQQWFHGGTTGDNKQQSLGGEEQYRVKFKIGGKMIVERSFSIKQTDTADATGSTVRMSPSQEFLNQEKVTVLNIRVFHSVQLEYPMTYNEHL